MINIGIILCMAAETAQGRTAITNLTTGLLTFVEVMSQQADTVAPSAPLIPATPSAPAPPPAPATPATPATPAVPVTPVVPATPPAPAPVVAEAVTVSAKKLTPEVKKSVHTFPEDYTILADALNIIDTKYMRQLVSEDNLLRKAAIAVDICRYMIKTVPGVLVSSGFKSMQHVNINNVINELTKAKTTATPDQLTQINTYISEFKKFLWLLQIDRSIKFSWYTADGTRITIVQFYEGTFREIRHGNLTGMDLKKAGVMTWENSDELMKYWHDNNISYSDIATAYNRY